MRILLILTYLLIGLPSVAFAQIDSCSYSVNGRVLDKETNQPISYVNVEVLNAERFTTTNSKGEFEIKGLCTDSNTLVISCVGYSNSVCDYHNHDGKTSHIYLTEDVQELEMVTIQVKRQKELGTKTISQVAVKKIEIKSNPTQSLASALVDQQGVALTSAGTNIQLPVIHGLYGNRILILNNGLKHGFQNWGTDHAPEIDINSANNITVIKGASGVRFGPEALGGAIIVQPNPLYLDESLNAEAGTGYQSNGRGFNTSLEVGEGFENWSYYFGGNYTKIGDRHAPDYMLTNSGKEEASANLGVRYRKGNWDFKLHYSYINQKLALLRSSIAESGDAFIKALNAEEPVFIKPFSYDINEPNQQAQHHFSKVEINWWYSKDGKLTFRAGQQLNNRQEFDVRRNADRPIVDLDLLTSDYQVEWKHPRWRQLNGLVGVQYFNQNNDNNPGTGTTPLIPNYNTSRFSGFVTENKNIGKHTFEAGVRLDYELNNVRGRETNQDIFKDEYSFTNVTSSIGYVRKISKNNTFRTNLGTAWRTPNMAELYSFGQHGFKTSFGLLRYHFSESDALKTNQVIKMKNSNVQPEKGYKFINEYQVRKNRNAHTVTVYSHYIENFIFNRPFAVIGTIRGPMPVFIYDQADALFVGADYSLKTNWSEHVAGTFGLSYLWSQNLDKKEALINQPPVVISYKLDWNLGKLWKFDSSSLVLKPSYTFKQFNAPRTVKPEDLIDGTITISPNSEIFDFKEAPDGYLMLNASWRFKWKQFNGSISVNNILNTTYRNYLNEMRYFADELGRNFIFNLNYSLKTSKK